MSSYSQETLSNCQSYVKKLHCQRTLIVGSLTVYLVNKIQFHLSLCFELFDLKTFRFGTHKMHFVVKSLLGSILRIHLSSSCQTIFLVNILQNSLNCAKVTMSQNSTKLPLQYY